MLLKELRKIYKGNIAIFNYKGEPIYNTFDKKYPIECLDEKEVLEINSYNNLIQVRILK